MDIDSEIIIDKAHPEDAREIQHVFYDTWLATYPNKEYGITRDDIEFRHKERLTDETIEKRKKVLAEMPDNELFLTAKSSGKIAGVCYAIKREDKNQLQAIYILPEYQNKGIGKKLWLEALSFFDPAKDTYVEVTTYNQNAIDFYKRLGFVDTGRRFSDERFRMKSGSIMPEMEMVLRA